MPEIVYNLNKAPYYDTTNDELKKGYVQFIAVDGQRLQNRELNVMQGLLRGNIKKVTDKIIDDGTVVSGCNFTNDEVKKICTLTEGEVYINGTIVPIPKTTWTYNETNEDVSQVPSGKAIVYADILPYVYDASDDPSLYNPAENYESFGDPGGYRLKYIAEVYIASEFEYSTLIADDSSAKTIVALTTIKDRNNVGVIKEPISLSYLNKQIIERTYDTSGDFIADGLEVSAMRNSNDSTKYIIHVSAGRCYVKGYQFKFIDQNVSWDNNSVNVDSTSQENHYFDSNREKYYLNHKYVKDISSLIAETVVTKTINTSSDYIDDICDKETYLESLFVKLISITAYESGSTTPKIKTNYTLKGNHTIQWNTDDISSIPSSYQAKFIYKKSMEVSIDYYLTCDDTGYYITFDPSIDVSENYTYSTQFMVSYSWYLSRIDLVYVNAVGTISIKSGGASDTETLVEPTQPANCLPLAVIYVIPTTEPSNYVIKNHGLYRVPVGQLQDMKKRLDNIEYDITMNNLESMTETAHYMESNSNKGTAFENSSYNLKNIYSDPVVNYSRCELDNPCFDATVDIFSNTIQLPMIIDQIGSDKIRIQEEALDANGKTVYNIVDVSNGEICMANKTGTWTNGKWSDTKVGSISQMHATSTIDLAPYYYKGLMPTITCTPTNLTYVQDDDSTVVIWLPNRVIYSSSYVDTIVKTTTNTVKSYSNNTSSVAGKYYDSASRSWVASYSNSSENFAGGDWGWGHFAGGNSSWIQTGTSELSTNYTYQTTGASYTSSIVGSEVVETTKSAVTNIAQPYMKAGQTIRISGQDFDSSTEIRFYLDDVVITPVFNNTRYPSNGGNYAFTSSTDKNGGSYDVSFNTLNTDRTPTIYRPWQWQICKDANRGLWKLYHPKDAYGNGIEYYYNESSDSWSYIIANKNTTNSTTTTSLSTKPRWAQYISRSPWMKYFINNSVTNSDYKTQWNKYNNYDPSTGSDYTDTLGYSTSKITVITDQYGKFEIDIAIPENTPTGSHIIKAETVFPLHVYTDDNGDEQREISADYAKYATGSFTGSSYLRHWDTTIYKRQIEQVKETVYHDVTVTRWSLSTGYYHDPVCQTFSVTSDQYLEGIDLFFSQVAANSEILPWISLREVENGQPLTDLILDQTISKSDIVLADNSETGVKAEKPTYIKFDYPVFIEKNKQYAFTVGANQNGYQIYYSELGKYDVGDNKAVQYQDQQLGNGVMMTSSNNSTWTAKQEADLKFVLYKTEYSTARDKVYYIDGGTFDKSTNLINTLKSGTSVGIQTKLDIFSTFNLSLGNSVLDNTDIYVYYSLDSNNVTDSNKKWIKMTLEDAVPISFSSERAKGMKLMFKIVLRTNDANITPVVNFNKFDLFMSVFKTSGEYIQLPFTLN